jgi:hypothetical protein
MIETLVTISDAAITISEAIMGRRQLPTVIANRRNGETETGLHPSESGETRLCG